MTIVATLLSEVLPGVDALAAAEMYDDPPELAPLPEEEPLIAKSVAKRRNEFITVRYCARQALGELGVAPVPHPLHGLPRRRRRPAQRGALGRHRRRTARRAAQGCA